MGHARRIWDLCYTSGRIASWVTGIWIVTVVPKAMLETSSSVGWWQSRQEGVQRKEARPSGCAFEQDTGTFYFLAATESTALFSHVLLSRYSALLNQKGEVRAKTPAAVRTVWPCDLTGLPSVWVTESGHRDQGRVCFRTRRH